MEVDFHPFFPQKKTKKKSFGGFFGGLPFVGWKNPGDFFVVFKISDSAF